jgi:hypothetical protein
LQPFAKEANALTRKTINIINKFNTMKKIISLILFCVVLSSYSMMTFAQLTNPLAYLQQECPQLTAKYKSELDACRAHYIFAVDVSLSMAKYESTVLPALDAFVKALPEGDRVTIIPFAKTAQDNRMGFNVEINKDTRPALVNLLPTLYPQGNDKKDKQYYDTDIYEVQQAIAKSIRAYSNYEVNLVVFISDLLHCPKNNVDRKFDPSEMESMKNVMQSAKNEAQNLIFALELPQSGSPEGYVLDQLREIYALWDVNIEQQRVPVNGEALIRQWFDQQKDRIMFTKLQSIILRENRANPIEVKTEIDIDGNVIADIKWKATKLYPMITLDTVYLKNDAFKFVPNPEFIGYSEAGELNAQLELGQIKHKSFGFHNLADTLYFDVKLPVEYQNEVDKLLEGHPGPLANTTEYKERLIWTFIFSLRTTIILLILILLYIILFFKAVSRNNKLCFKGKMTVYDNNGNQLDDVRHIPLQKSGAVLLFGSGASPKCGVNDAEWQFEIRKVKGNPFLLFKKPYFEWKCKKGYVGLGKAQSGALTPPTGSVKVTCGKIKSEPTHSVRVQLVAQ